TDHRRQFPERQRIRAAEAALHLFGRKIRADEIACVFLRLGAGREDACARQTPDAAVEQRRLRLDPLHELSGLVEGEDAHAGQRLAFVGGRLGLQDRLAIDTLLANPDPVRALLEEATTLATEQRGFHLVAALL